MTIAPNAHVRPITFDEATERGLVIEYPATGIYTFSNGSDWDYWAARNCHECRFYDPNVAGEHCAFEAAAFLRAVSPDLARLFGWTENAEYPGCFDRPDACPFFRGRDEDDDGESMPPPFTDPAQLVLLADPTEDAAMLNQNPSADPVPLTAAISSGGRAGGKQLTSNA